MATKRPKKSKIPFLFVLIDFNYSVRCRLFPMVRKFIFDSHVCGNIFSVSAYIWFIEYAVCSKVAPNRSPPNIDTKKRPCSFLLKWENRSVLRCQINQMVSCAPCIFLQKHRIMQFVETHLGAFLMRLGIYLFTFLLHGKKIK